MQNQEMKHAQYVLLSIPVDMLLDAGLFDGDLLQFRIEEGKVIIEAAYVFGPAGEKGERPAADEKERWLD